MSIFDKLFGRKPKAADTPSTPPNTAESLPEPAPAVEETIPYELLTVPGAEALDLMDHLRQQGNGEFTPILVGDADELEWLGETLSTREDTPREILAQAASLDPFAALSRRESEDPEYYGEVEVGEWPDEEVVSESILGHMNVMNGRPHKRVAVVKVPTAHVWEVPAYLNFGGWNECPDPQTQVALLKQWHESHGAALFTVSRDGLELTVARPPADRDAALVLARQHFVYCPDGVYQGTETLSRMASCLEGSSCWGFWWD